MEALRERKVPVDGVLHGLFDDKNPLEPGRKTIADAWNVIPYENYLVTAELKPDELTRVMEEVFRSFDGRNLMGFDVRTDGKGKERRITVITLPNGEPLERGRAYRIAMNSFDSCSAGHRFMILRDLVQRKEARAQLHLVQTREALIEYFQRHKVVCRIPRPSELKAAA